MKAVFLLELFLIMSLFPSVFPKIDLNVHLEEINVDAVYGNFKWSNGTDLLMKAVDAALNPNIRGLYVLYKKLHISSECFESLQSIIMGLRSNKRWAVEMVDASGKIPGGILDGTIMDFGSLDECLRIKVHESSRTSNRKEIFRGRYCMVGYDSPLFSPIDQKSPDGVSYIDLYGDPPEWAHEVLERAGGYMKTSALWFGTCVPSTCSADDIQRIAGVVAKPLGFNVTVADCQIDEPYVWPSYVTVSVVILSCLATLCAIGTLMDAICRCRKSNPTDTQADGMLLRIPKAFSLLTNTEKLFCAAGGGGSLSCFHGIRFLSATWIVLGHTYFYTDTWKYIKSRSLLRFQDIFDHRLPAAVIENFTIPVGTFFFMSGFLLMYTTWRKLEKSDGKLNFFMFVVHKYWRMTPAIALMLVMFFCMPLIDSGPLWNSTLNPPLQNCRNLWWANLLYINNFWNTREYCLLHTWYMAALMQFHILGVLLLVVSYRWPVVGVIMGSMIMVICSVEVALLVIWHDFPMPASGVIKDMDIIEDYNSRIYIKPYTHFTTYMIGMVVGYAVLKFHNKKLSMKYQILGWILATVGALASVFGIYGPAEDVATRVFYIIGHRIGWALSIGWLIYACATGIGGIVNRLLSWNAMCSLGQLSYLTYLIHPLVIIYKDASIKERVYFGHTELVCSFLSTLMISLFLAYVGYVAVETPFSILENIVFRSRPKINFKKTENKENEIISRQNVSNP